MCLTLVWIQIHSYYLLHICACSSLGHAFTTYQESLIHWNKFRFFAVEADYWERQYWKDHITSLTLMLQVFWPVLTKDIRSPQCQRNWMYWVAPVCKSHVHLMFLKIAIHLTAQYLPYLVWIKESPYFGGSLDNVIFNSSKTDNTYQAKITGNMSWKDCTTVFFNVTTSYTNIYFFRIESRPFKATDPDKSVHIVVTGKKQFNCLSPQKICLESLHQIIQVE